MTGAPCAGKSHLRFGRRARAVLFYAYHPLVRFVRIDPCYFRPTNGETLLGDPIKATQKLGWGPEITVQELCAEMVTNGLAQNKQHAVLEASGYQVNVSVE